MSDWRVFWYPKPTRFDKARDVKIASEDQILSDELHAKALASKLVGEGYRGVSVNVPPNGRELKGKTLLTWLSSAGS